jgi:hypothetical protein
MWFESILETVGYTPTIRGNRQGANLPATVRVKVVKFDPGHFIKDRLALKMIGGAGSAMAGLLQSGKHLKATGGIGLIFHEQGTPKLNQTFNDEWMRERGYPIQRAEDAAGLVLRRGLASLVKSRIAGNSGRGLDQNPQNSDFAITDSGCQGEMGGIPHQGSAATATDS